MRRHTSFWTIHCTCDWTRQKWGMRFYPVAPLCNPASGRAATGHSASLTSRADGGVATDPAIFQQFIQAEPVNGFVWQSPTASGFCLLVACETLALTLEAGVGGLET